MSRIIDVRVEVGETCADCRLHYCPGFDEPSYCRLHGRSQIPNYPTPLPECLIATRADDKKKELQGSDRALRREVGDYMGFLSLTLQ